MRCPNCGYEACQNWAQCEKESKLHIEETILSEVKNGPFDPRESLTNESFLAIIAGKLMRKWFKK